MLTRRIMLADTDDTLMEVYRDHLARRGFSVRTAPGGVTCLEMLRQFRPHLLLLGATLPWGGYDGVLAVLDEEPRLRPLYVIVLTREESEHLLQRRSRGHIDDYQFHPLLPDRLVGYVEALFEEHADRAGLT